MVSKALVLVTQTENVYFPEKCSCCELVSLYKSSKLLSRVLRKMMFEFNMPFHRLVFSHWVDKIKDSEKIIIFDTGNASRIIKWLRKKYPDKRVILWYWNPVERTISPESIKTDGVEIYSFDKDDCEKYNIKYNTQFFIEENLNRNCNVSVDKSDVIYVGADKGRAKILFEISQHLDKEGISYFYNLVSRDDRKNNYGIEYKEPISYPEVMDRIKLSRAIIDLVVPCQSGLTLRPLEALFCKKKLITNMERIVDYDFYNGKNIFILGKDNLEYLGEFINSEYDMSNYEEMIKTYSFKAWVSRF